MALKSARIADFSDKLSRFADLKITGTWIVDQAKNLARIPEFVYLEVRIVALIINFLVGFGWYIGVLFFLVTPAKAESFE